MDLWHHPSDRSSIFPRRALVDSGVVLQIDLRGSADDGCDRQVLTIGFRGFRLEDLGRHGIFDHLELDLGQPGLFLLNFRQLELGQAA